MRMSLNLVGVEDNGLTSPCYPGAHRDAVLSNESFRVGKTIEDFCRPCKSIRAHTITLVDADSRPSRVMCDTCKSDHHYRGVSVPVDSGERAAKERSRSPMSDSSPEDSSPVGSATDLETLLRRILREETGWAPTNIAEKWRGGEMLLRPGKPGLQEKSLPIDALFRKVVSIRNKLRVLEQQVNAADVPDDLKLRLQSYITGCYGSLTSFNVLFAKEEDRFRGSAKDD
jgi:hypothetical protein